MNDFFKEFRGVCSCSDSSCMRYGYTMSSLKKQDVNFTDVNSLLTFLSDKSDSVKASSLTACKVYYRHVLKDAEKSDQLL